VVIDKTTDFGKNSDKAREAIYALQTRASYKDSDMGDIPMRKLN